MTRLLPVFAAATLLFPLAAAAQDAPLTPGPELSAPATGTPTAPARGGTTPPAGGSAAGVKPTPAQQAVLDRIRRLRDGDQRRFGSCSYRWDRWKLQSDGSRTTTYSCDGTQIVDHTIGVNCSKLQINSYTPAADAGGKAKRGTGGSWRLPQPGGEEQMVATLCANALPAPASSPPAASTPTSSTPASSTPASPKPAASKPASSKPTPAVQGPRSQASDGQVAPLVRRLISSATPSVSG